MLTNARPCFSWWFMFSCFKTLAAVKKSNKCVLRHQALLFMSEYNALSYQVGKIWHYYYEGDQGWEAAGKLLCFCEVQKKAKLMNLGKAGLRKWLHLCEEIKWCQ